MALTLPDTFKKHSVKQNWLVLLYNSGGGYTGVSFYDTVVSSNQFYGAIINKPKIRESISLKKSTSSTSNVNITVANFNISGTTFSGIIYGTSTRYINRDVKIYIQPEDDNDINNCLLIYTGKLSSVSHDIKSVKLNIEARRPWDGVEIPQVKTIRNNYFPVAYGDYRPNASTSDADSVAISASTSSGDDEYRNRKTLYPIPVDFIKGNTVYSLTGEWSQTSKAYPHFYEKSLDKFLPIANHASTYTTVDSANEVYGDGYAVRFHKNLLKATLFKPLGRISSGSGWASNENAVDGTTTDTSTFTQFDVELLDFTDDQSSDISFTMPSLTGIPTTLQVFPVIKATCTFSSASGSGAIRVNVINYSFSNEDVSGYFRFTGNTASSTTMTATVGGDVSSTALIGSNSSISNNFLSSGSGWGEDLAIRIKQELESGSLDGRITLDLKLYDIIIQSITKLDFTATTTSGKSEAGNFIADLDFVYCGGDGLPDNGWNSNSAITEIHEAHRDLLHRFTSYTNSNTPINWSSGTNINSIKDWKIRKWVNEPVDLLDVLQELQFEGGFIFRFNSQNQGQYIFIPDSISTDHTLNTDDLASINVSLSNMSEVITRMDIEYDKHPVKGYVSSVSASNSTATTNLNIGTAENKKKFRLNALTSAPASSPSSNPNDDFYTYYNNIFGDQKLIVKADIINPSFYGIDVGDFVAFNTMPVNPFGESWSGKDFIVTKVSREIGKLKCEFREV